MPKQVRKEAFEFVNRFMQMNVVLGKLAKQSIDRLNRTLAKGEHQGLFTVLVSSLRMASTDGWNNSCTECFVTHTEKNDGAILPNEPQLVVGKK